jgi:hypothetical protein
VTHEIERSIMGRVARFSKDDVVFEQLDLVIWCQDSGFDQSLVLRDGDKAG